DIFKYIINAAIDGSRIFASIRNSVLALIVSVVIIKVSSILLKLIRSGLYDLIVY
ncbi:36384_t:CDS:1, partial [Gigaspora margarita]